MSKRIAAYLAILRLVQKIYAFVSNKQTKAGDRLNGNRMILLRKRRME